MKKIIIASAIICFFTLANPTPTFAGKVDDITNTVPDSNADNPDQATVLLQRLDEIKTMDKSDLSSAEKKELRTEVRTIKEKLAAAGGGVYLSLGAIIIIGILLIIFL